MNYRKILDLENKFPKVDNLLAGLYIRSKALPKSAKIKDF